MQVLVNPILPGKFNPLVFRAEFLKAGDESIGDFAKDTDKTEYTWREKAKFNKEIKSASDSMRFQYWTADKVVKFLEKGTKVRHALMTPDFSPKTKRRYIGSDAGRGGVLIISKKINRPGIKAREWFPEIRDRRRLSTYSRFAAAMRRAAKLSGHGA